MVRATALKVGHSAVEGVPNNKANREKMVQEAPTNSALRRKLGDITNLQNQRQLMNQGAKQQQKQALLLSSTEYAEKLLKENMRLKKVITERNEIIEQSGSELQKLRNNFKKVQEQNVQLAQGNTRIMAESNTLKDQLKALQHELGCKNGLLLASRKTFHVSTAMYQKIRIVPTFLMKLAKSFIQMAWIIVLARESNNQLLRAPMLTHCKPMRMATIKGEFLEGGIPSILKY